MNTRKRAELYRDPEDIAFTKWVDESFPIRSNIIVLTSSE